MWGLFEDTLAISWLYSPGDDEMRQKIARDSEAQKRRSCRCCASIAQSRKRTWHFSFTKA